MLLCIYVRSFYIHMMQFGVKQNQSTGFLQSYVKRDCF